MAPPSADLPNDPELVARWRQGDELAAAALFQKHAIALGRYLSVAGAQEAEIDDLIQESFFRAFRSIDAWRGEGSFRAWLFRIGTNQLRDRYRREKGRTWVAIEDHDIADSADPDAELLASEGERQLIKGVAALPRLQREVFLLRVQQGLDYKEIAVALDTTAGAARVHYHHAVKRLKELLA